MAIEPKGGREWVANCRSNAPLEDDNECICGAERRTSVGTFSLGHCGHSIWNSRLSACVPWQLCCTQSVRMGGSLAVPCHAGPIKDGLLWLVLAHSSLVNYPEPSLSTGYLRLHCSTSVSSHRFEHCSKFAMCDRD